MNLYRIKTFSGCDTNIAAKTIAEALDKFRKSPEFDERIRQTALRDGLLLVEVLERALEAYEQRRKG